MTGALTEKLAQIIYNRREARASKKEYSEELRKKRVIYGLKRIKLLISNTVNLVNEINLKDYTDSEGNSIRDTREFKKLMEIITNINEEGLI